MTRLRGHVAGRLIAEDRDPTDEEAAHLDRCPDCFAVVRRRRPFDLRLTAAAAELVTMPLPREVLLVDAAQGSRRRLGPAGIIASFLVVVAVGVGGFVMWQTARVDGSLVGADPAEAEPPNSVLAGEEHVVEVPGDDIAVTEADDGVMIVTRLSSPEPQVLARAPLPVGGSAGFAMVCSWSDNISMGLVYGVLEPAMGPPTFKGPAAAGYAGEDGMFLYAFNPFDAEARDVAVVGAEGTGFGWGQDTFAVMIKNRGVPLGPNGAQGMTCQDSTGLKP